MCRACYIAVQTVAAGCAVSMFRQRRLFEVKPDLRLPQSSGLPAFVLS